MTATAVRGPIAVTRTGLPFAAVAFATAVGLALVAAVDMLSRATLGPSSAYLWLGVALIIVPAVLRLLQTGVGTAERVSVLLLMGLALYAVKVMRDPYLFTLTDEWSHAFAAKQTLATHHLYGNNPVLPVAAYYPGLQGATVAIAQLTGMSPFAAGVLLIGASRAVLMVALFSLFATVGGSERAAGIGAAAYAADAHFLLWDGQYAYESLAFPLFVLVLACVAQRDAADPATRRGFAVAAAILALAVVLTHHVTSYVMVVTLVLLCIRVRPLRLDKHTGSIAVVAVVAVGAWLITAASLTVSYLTPNITVAIDSAFRTITGQGGTYTPFSAGTAYGAQNTPFERYIGIASVLLTAAALLVSLRPAWRHSRNDGVGVLLFGASILFLPAPALRAAPDAWEVSSRVVDYLFVGVAFVIGWAPVDFIKDPRLRALSRWVVALALAVMVVGNAVDGLDPSSRLPLPTAIKADGSRIQSPAIALSDWFRTAPAGLVVAPDADASVIALFGNHPVATGFQLEADAILSSRAKPNYAISLWKRNRVRYIVVDLRGVATGLPAGVDFAVTSKVGYRSSYLSPTVATRFDAAGLSRVYSSGYVYVYEMPR